jgi:hypothetical protein
VAVLQPTWQASTAARWLASATASLTATSTSGSGGRVLRLAENTALIGGLHAASALRTSATREPFALGQTDVPGEPTYFAARSLVLLQGQVISAVLAQPIEDVRTFAGQQVTVSFLGQGRRNQKHCRQYGSSFWHWRIA